MNEPSDEKKIPESGFIKRTRQDQPSLFAGEGIDLPASLTHFKKPVAAIHVTPVDASLSLNDRRVLDACILTVQLQSKQMGKGFIEKVRNDRICAEFDVSISEMATLCDIRGKHQERIYQSLDDLYDMDFLWNVVGESEQIEWKFRKRFLISLGRGVGGKAGRIRFAVHPDLLMVFLEPSMWAKLALNDGRSGLTTSASYALYQNTWRYINTHQKRTPVMALTTWIELLIGKSRYVEEASDGSKSSANYGDFKRRHLMDAIERVNNVAALSHTLALKEFISGKKVTRLQFMFEPKRQESLELPITWSQDVLDFLCDGIGMSEPEVQMLSEAHSCEQVMDSIGRLKSAQDRLKARGQRIHSKKAFFLGILNNVSQGASESEDDSATEQAEQIEVQRLSEERQVRQREAFEDYERAQFRSAVEAIPESGRNALVQRYMDSAQGKKQSAMLPAPGASWPQKAGAAWTLLRIWLKSSDPQLYQEILPQPQARSFESWLVWRLDGGDAAA